MSLNDNTQKISALIAAIDALPDAESEEEEEEQS